VNGFAFNGFAFNGFALNGFALRKVVRDLPVTDFGYHRIYFPESP